MRLVSTAKNWGILPLKEKALKFSLLEDIPENWKFLQDYYELFEADINVARNILMESNKDALYHSQIDFDDMVYLPVVLDLKIFGTDFMVVDEAQDLSLLNLRLLSKSPSRISYVGDPFQCIYTWRGAKEDTMETLSLPILPLTESFRCSGNIIKEAQKYVPDIRTGNEEGLPVVRYYHLPDFSERSPATVLSRRNAQLISFALHLRGLHKQVYILGRDLAKTLKEILENLKGTNSEALRMSLLSWRGKMMDKYPHKENEIEDLFRCLFVLLSEVSGKKEVEKLLDSLFTNKPSENAWTLSTIHRAKGKEWDIVYLLDWVPKNLHQPWQRQEDRNLRYVGVTRAKKQLFILDETAQKLEENKEGTLEEFLKSA